MKHYVYLAGPIAGSTYGEATEWRDLMAESLNSDKIECLSPMRGKAFLAKETTISAGQYVHNAMSSEKGINRRDFFDCTRASCVLINFEGAKRVSIGTCMEIAWAFQARIPVIVVTGDDVLHEHCMINDCVTYKVKTLLEARRLVKFLFNDLPQGEDSDKP
jgi:nucleoside 2-deoxyribosyltransferase